MVLHDACSYTCNTYTNIRAWYGMLVYVLLGAGEVGAWYCMTHARRCATHIRIYEHGMACSYMCCLVRVSGAPANVCKAEIDRSVDTHLRRTHAQPTPESDCWCRWHTPDVKHIACRSRASIRLVRSAPQRVQLVSRRCHRPLLPDWQVCP
jgi:hypothetical protein